MSKSKDSEPRRSQLRGLSAGLGVILTLIGIGFGGVGSALTDDGAQRWMVARTAVGESLIDGSVQESEDSDAVDGLRTWLGGPAEGSSWSNEHAAWKPGMIENVGIGLLLGALFFVMAGCTLADRDPA